MGKKQNDELMEAAVKLLSAMVKTANTGETGFEEEWNYLEEFLAEEDGDTLEDKIQGLLNTRDELNDEINALHAGQASLQKKLKFAEQTTIAAERREEELREQILQLRATNDSLSKAHKQQQTTLIALQKRINTLQGC